MKPEKRKKKHKEKEREREQRLCKVSQESKKEMPKPKREKQTIRNREKVTEEKRERECYVTLSSRRSAKTRLGLPRYYKDRDFLMEQIKWRSSGRPADA